ncbi:MAG: hypothetical protein ACXVUX_21685, partial [Solirubrobacteraceae bacterium]
MAVTSTPTGPRARNRLWLVAGGAATLIVAVIVVVLVSGGGTTQKPAKLPVAQPKRVGPDSMFTAGSVTLYTPPLLNALQALGVDSIHVYMHWSDIAPDIQATHKPDFDANDPGAYPAVGWAPFDELVRQVAARKMGLAMDLVAPPPRWAASP